MIYERTGVVAEDWLGNLADIPVARFKVRIPSHDRKLVRWGAWSRKHPWSGMPDLDDSLFKRAIKSDWIYFGEIPPPKLIEVDVETGARETFDMLTVRTCICHPCPRRSGFPISGAMKGSLPRRDVGACGEYAEGRTAMSWALSMVRATSLPRRGLSREEAAAYAGCESLSTFSDWARRGIRPG